MIDFLLKMSTSEDNTMTTEVSTASTVVGPTLPATWFRDPAYVPEVRFVNERHMRLLAEMDAYAAMVNISGWQGNKKEKFIILRDWVVRRRIELGMEYRTRIGTAASSTRDREDASANRGDEANGGDDLASRERNEGADEEHAQAGGNEGESGTSLQPASGLSGLRSGQQTERERRGDVASETPMENSGPSNEEIQNESAGGGGVRIPQGNVMGDRGSGVTRHADPANQGNHENGGSLVGRSAGSGGNPAS